LNVEPKNGGHYLPENRSWAKQTIAHNTLVVDETSHFNGDWREGEKYAPKVIAFNDAPGRSFVAVAENSAYESTTLQRVVALVNTEDGREYIVDILQGVSDAKRTYDLPVHFKGQLIESSASFVNETDQLVPLGTRSGYQHLWKTAESETVSANEVSKISTLIGDQFYTISFASDLPMRAYLTRLGANDPNNNLRPEQALVLRTQGEDVVYVSVYERHGRYDSDEEVTVYNGGSVSSITIEEDSLSDSYKVTTRYGDEITVLVAKDAGPDAAHSTESNSEAISSQGPVSLRVSLGQNKHNKLEEK